MEKINVGTQNHFFNMKISKYQNLDRKKLDFFEMFDFFAIYSAGKLYSADLGERRTRPPVGPWSPLFASAIREKIL